MKDLKVNLNKKSINKTIKNIVVNQNINTIQTMKKLMKILKNLMVIMNLKKKNQQNKK